MADEVVVREPLTSEMKTAGVEVIRSLRSAGMDLDLTFWLYTSDSNDWRLMIATPLVDTEGPRKTYARIGKALPNYIDKIREFDMLSITVISPNDKLVRSLKSVNLTSGQAAQRVRGLVKDVYIEDSYVYC